ncbi:MAG: sugar phosphate isomerase/epimerase [Pirellulales bacterium]|nr:sugar phosphate isomerase/epimerase [Pirellulales bacterium]
MKFNNFCGNQTSSRREFLSYGVGAAWGVGALAALGRSPLFAADDAASLKSKMRIGLATFKWGADWDIPAIIANCQKAGLFGVELRTSSKYPHGVETTLGAKQRAEVKKRFADSPVRIVSIACSEAFDSPKSPELQAAVAAAKAHLELSRDVGCDVLRVFPNAFHPNVPREKTIAQIARALDELGAFADGLGQEVSLEAHGTAGELPTMRAIMDQTTRRNVRVRLNCDPRDAKGKGFAENFNLVKDRLSRIVHLHDLGDPAYPYQLMVDLLVKAKWTGWALLERSEKVPDRVAAMSQQRQVWESMLEKAAQTPVR